MNSAPVGGQRGLCWHDQMHTTPFLMSQNVAADVGLGALNEFNIGLHSFFAESLRELVRDVGVRVKSSERDELEEAAMSARVCG